MSKSLLKTFSLAIFVISLTTTVFAQQKFYINLNNRTDDVFHVVLYPKDLSQDNNVYQFASTAPGTYEEMDIGRYVKSFKAFDKNENEISTTHSSLNEWTISDPTSVNKIVYDVEDTWDTPVDSNRIYLMCGSSIEKDNVLINGQCVFGYFKGMQSYPIEVKLDYPKTWLVGTALTLDKDGYYEADTYDKIVDSPILLGNLTQSSLNVGNSKIDLFTYSKNGIVKSDDLVKSLKDVLNAESKFMNGLPVNHYTFLFHFEKYTAGAWEHSYSSEYIYREDSLSPKFVSDIRKTVAHEFFHIVTPLNIHSELISKFNFVHPNMSRHLWLYEGVTEWAANILELRGNLISLPDYLKVLQRKVNISENFDKSISLTYLGTHSTELQSQYPNIYMKGALVAGLLDIKLLELSNGKMGLREVINKLSKIYGPKKSFSEENFFNDFTKMTFQEIGDFFDKYVKGTEALPYDKYYHLLGIDYQKLGDLDSSKAVLGISFAYNGKNLVAAGVSQDSKNIGLVKAGDVIEKVNGKTLTIQNMRSIFGMLHQLKIGDNVNMTLNRDNKEVEVKLTIGPSRTKDIFTVDPNPTEKQLMLRKAWLKNL